MLRDDQIDKISELFLDLGKGLLLAGFAIPFFTQSDIIIFWKYFLGGISSAIFAVYILKLKEKRL